LSGGCPPPERAAGAPPRSLRLLTWNIHRGRSALGRNRLAAMRELLAALAPDVALLQEVLGEHDGDQAERLADGWGRAVFAPVRRRGRGVQGNALLTRLPVRTWQAVDVSTNLLERRSYLHVELRHGGAPLHVIGMHLGLTRGGRARQVDRLAALIAAAVPARAPLVVAGDSNDWRGHAAGALAALDLTEAHAVLHGRAARTYPAWLPRLRLDRVYLRGLTPGTARAVTEARGLSDHLPLLVETD
jgi:endonuclease/exonuclease/phosphatase family metal-dependent hydrolase